MGVSGYLVWWEILNSDITGEAFNELLRKHAVNYHYTPKSYALRFRAACKQFNNQAHEGKYLIKRIRTARNHLLYGFMEAEIDENAGFSEYVQVSALKFWTQSGILDAEPDHPKVDTLRRMYLHTSFGVGDLQLRLIVIKEFSRAFNFTIKTKSGVFWLLPRDLNKVERLAKVVREIPGDNKFVIIPLDDTEETKEIFREGALQEAYRRVDILLASAERQKNQKLVRHIKANCYPYMDRAALLLTYLYDLQRLYGFDFSEQIEKIEETRTVIGALIDEILPDPT